MKLGFTQNLQLQSLKTSGHWSVDYRFQLGNLVKIQTTMIQIIIWQLSAMTIVIALAGSPRDDTKGLALILSIISAVFFIVVADGQAGSFPSF